MEALFVDSVNQTLSSSSAPLVAQPFEWSGEGLFQASLRHRPENPSQPDGRKTGIVFVP